MPTSPTAEVTTETERRPVSMTANPGYTTPTPEPSRTRALPGHSMMRRGATAALFGAGTTRTPSPYHAGEDDSQRDSQRRHGSSLGPDLSLSDLSQRRENLTEEDTESWTLFFHLVEPRDEQENVQVEMKRCDITIGNLVTLKSRFGYSVRDFLYYKQRSGNNVAQLWEVDSELDASGMITMNDNEREVRLVLSRDKITERNVNITPIKVPPGTAFYEDFTDEPIDEYKDWLEELHKNGVGRELHDTFRDDTVKTYSEWLRLEGQLDDIEAYAEITSTQPSQSSNPTPPVQRPSHARREKALANDRQRGSEKRKFKGRGPMKGFTAADKRIKHGNMKLQVQFSSRLGGPVGANQRSFVDEVVLFTRKSAPLIGVRKWKNIKDDVKERIAEDVMDKWDLEDNLENKQKIWNIANERYKGWRSTFSATYRAYDNYDERMRHKLEDLHIVEWHYLVLYFGTEEFQNLSNKNSRNRSLAQTKHMMGSKPFSQCSYELRDPLTGEEPNDLELWVKTHSKEGQWTSEASRAVYENARTKTAEKETESQDSFIPPVERNLIFQAAYKQTIRTKASKVYGNGYLARYPSRRQLMTERFEEQARSETASHMENEELRATLEKVQEQLQSQVEEREAEKEEHRRQMEELQKAREADKEQLRQEFLSMLTAQRQGPPIQVNQAAIETAAQETTANETAAHQTPSNAHEPIVNQGEETSQENESALNHNEKALHAASTHACNNVRTTRGSISRNQSQNKEGNGTQNYITSKQLTDAASKKRASKRN